MKLTYLYVAVDDIVAALPFYRDTMGLDEAWREGEGTVAFVLPGTDVQLMLDRRVDDGAQWASGPMYLVDDLDAWVADHPDVPRLGEPVTAPQVRILAFTDPGGNAFHVFELTEDEG